MEIAKTLNYDRCDVLGGVVDLSDGTIISLTALHRLTVESAAVATKIYRYRVKQ